MAKQHQRTTGIANRNQVAIEQNTIVDDNLLPPAEECALWLAFVLAIVVLLLSGLFIYMGKEVAGTIFGGVGILVVIQSFLKFGRK